MATITYMGTPYTYTELHAGSGEENFDLTPSSVTVATKKTILCAWTDRINVIKGFYGKPHADFAGVYALLFNPVGYGKPVAENTWKKAKIEIGFKNLPYSPTDNKEIHIETSAENVSIPGEGCEFDTGSDAEAKRVDYDPQVFLIFTQMTVTLHNQTSIDEAAWTAITNCVNSGSFNLGSGYETWVAGTVLYQGYSIDEKILSDGTKTFEVTHKLLGSTIDHRKDFNPQLGDYDKVKFKQSGNDKYEAASFSGLGI